jgi:mannose-6-phosphate isomerase-like protein (cupin superfamily)
MAAMTTMTSAPEERRIWNPVQRDAAILLESCEENGGQRTVLEIHLAPGGGNAPHRHLTYAEHFEVLHGELTVYVDGVGRTLGPGGRATAPAGTPHNFANPTHEEVRFLVRLQPGHRGFERALQIAYGMAEDGLTDKQSRPRDPRVLGLLAEMSDIGMEGPARLLEPLIGLLARAARRRGLDARLSEKYVRF